MLSRPWLLWVRRDRWPQSEETVGGEGAAGSGAQGERVTTGPSHRSCAFLSRITVPAAVAPQPSVAALELGLRRAGRGEEGPRAFGLQEALCDPPRVLCPQCLAAGSIIMNRELESMAMRPLAKELTRSLEDVRGALRDQALRDLSTYTEKMREALRHFDVLFAEFELR